LGDRFGCESAIKASAGTRNATACTPLRTRVTWTPLATRLSARMPDKELPTAMTSQGKKDRKLEARRSNPRACV